jgi:hypothetical protein
MRHATSSGYVGDTEGLSTSSPDTSLPTSPVKKPALLHEEFHIVDPVAFYHALGDSIRLALEKNPLHTKLERAGLFFKRLNPNNRFDLMKIILLASVMVEQKLIGNFLPAEFPNPETVKLKLAALHSDVKEAVNGKRYCKPVQDKPEPTYAETTYEVLATLGLIAKLGTEFGLDYVSKKVSGAVSGVATKVAGLYGSLFSSSSGSERSADDASTSPDKNDHDSSSWHIIPPAGEASSRL